MLIYEKNVKYFFLKLLVIKLHLLVLKDVSCIWIIWKTDMKKKANEHFSVKTGNIANFFQKIYLTF